MKELIKLSGYSLKYRDKTILNETTYSFYSGNVYLIDGQNGAGKSSFIKSLLGLDRKDKIESGSIEVNGSKNVLKMSDSELLERRSKVAYLEQKDYYDQFYGVTVREILIDSYKDFLHRKKLTQEEIEYIEKTFNKFVPADSALTLKKKVDKT